MRYFLLEGLKGAIEVAFPYAATILSLYFRAHFLLTTATTCFPKHNNNRHTHTHTDTYTYTHTYMHLGKFSKTHTTIDSPIY